MKFNANIILWASFASSHSPVRPGGVYQLASWLRNHGYLVKVIAFSNHLSTDDLINITEMYLGKETIAIGVSSMFWKPWLSVFSDTTVEPDWVIRARTILENKHPNIRWILGGTRTQDEPTHFSWIKMHGYAEDEILKWLDYNSNRYVRREPFDIKTNVRLYHDSDMIEPNEALSVELSRGCKFKCKFCSFPLSGKLPGTYVKNVECLKEEIIYNYEKWGTTKYYFQDDTANESKDKIISLEKIANELPFDIQWTGYLRLDLMSTWKDAPQVIKNTGIKSCLFGIESFHPDASASIGKGWNGKYAKDFLLELKDKWGPGINWKLSFIIGLPGDTEESIRETASWCIDNKMYSWIFTALSLNYTKKLYMSEFEKNGELYGYHFPDPAKPASWINGEWSMDRAKQLQIELNDLSLPHLYLSSWVMMELSHLEPVDKLIHTRIVDLDLPRHIEATRIFIDNYVQKHKNLT